MVSCLQIGFKTFDCSHLDVWRMDMNPEVICFSEEWRPVFLVGLAMLVVYGVVTPWAIWKQLHCADLQDAEMQSKFGWLYGRYRPACYYFEYVIMAQKVATAAVTTFLSNKNRAVISLPLMVLVTLTSQSLGSHPHARRPSFKTTLRVSSFFVLHTLCC